MLFNHQQKAIGFAIRNNACCALFHDPGLGKTLTALEVFKFYRSKQLKLFVVCPLSLINSAWGADINKYTNFSYASYRDIKGNIPDIVIVNYKTLISKKHHRSILDMLVKHRFMCVIDESSRLKNHRSVTAKTMLSIANMFDYRMILSGTPMPNSELELWAQINFIKPNLLHQSFYAFKNIFFHLERRGQTMPTGRIVSRMQMRDIFSQGWRYSITAQKREQLMKLIAPYVDWVKKEDAVDLPEQTEQIREIDLSAQERKHYQDMKTRLITTIGDVEIVAQVALAKLMKLRQVTSGFCYGLNMQDETLAIPIGYPSKLKELKELLEELGPRQLIIWIQFHYEVEYITKMIAETCGGHSIATLYSQTKDKDGEIERFKSGKARYLVAHPRSAGHGLTFTNCDCAIFYSLDYSWESYEQAKDRIHRIGQSNKCLYIYLLAKNSIDNVLFNVLEKKQDIQEAVYEIIAKRN